MSNQEEYRKWIALAQRIAAETGMPRFYIEQARPVGLSEELFATEPLVAAGLKMVTETAGFPGHGVIHITKVAIDTGALILIAAGGTSPGSGTRRQVLLAHLAGILHDIRREDRDHAEQGAQEAQRLLTRLSLPENECLQIAAAIRNHEAFRPRQAVPGRAAGLLSDSLYDADKFRWGPDNFTDTLWAMAASRGIPLARLVPRFLQGLDGIEKIRGSFRTPAGQRYGPDFIDRGLAIGRRLHAELCADVVGETESRKQRRGHSPWKGEADDVADD